MEWLAVRCCAVCSALCTVHWVAHCFMQFSALCCVQVFLSCGITQNDDQNIVAKIDASIYIVSPLNWASIMKWSRNQPQTEENRFFKEYRRRRAAGANVKSLFFCLIQNWMKNKFLITIGAGSNSTGQMVRARWQRSAYCSTRLHQFKRLKQIGYCLV